jgi:hypothetical protein
VAECSVRRGDVGEEISALCSQLGADYLVLGKPKVPREDNFFTPAGLAGFVDRIQKQMGVRVIHPRAVA